MNNYTAIFVLDDGCPYHKILVAETLDVIQGEIEAYLDDWRTSQDAVARDLFENIKAAYVYNLDTKECCCICEKQINLEWVYN